jgi:hypothetical protein
LLVGYDRVPDDLRRQFEHFVHTHLERRATTGSVTRERQFSCPTDGTLFPVDVVKQIMRRGRLSVLCPVCEQRVPLWDDYELNSGADQLAATMDASADAGREIAANSAVLRGKEEVAEYDPVLLRDANTADLQVFLQGLTWVNLAVAEPDPIDQLVWGITGRQSDR